MTRDRANGWVRVAARATAWAAATMCALSAQAQIMPEAAPGTIEAHLLKARQAARTDFTGTIARICVLPDGLNKPVKGKPVPPAPPRASWYAPPARVFDNLYWVGTKVHSSWALTSSQGIILIDTLYNYAAETEIVDGLRTLGLDPATIRYVIVTHAHSDHDEGARLLQDRFGAHVVFSAADWDLLDLQDIPGGAPKRDIVGANGDRITLGDTTVTLVSTPGHTPGTLSAIFNVKDGPRTLTVAYSGGTAFNFEHDVAHYTTYIESQQRMAKVAKDAGATILMSNHSEFDDAWDRVRLTRLRLPGEPSPFEIGADAVGRYFTVTGECAEAARMKLNETPSRAGARPQGQAG